MAKIIAKKMIMTSSSMNLEELIDCCPTRLHALFATYLQNIPAHELKSSMEYMLVNGGKYLRPLLIYATGLTFGATLENLDIPAGAVELIHTYSLIHDDLPCMDDADLRRGKPSCHRAYNEAIAVLTGDALHTLAMQIIAAHPANLSAERRVSMMKVLSKACGPYGMAAGQALDITLMTSGSLSSDLLENIYRLKTGALFSACIELGRLASTDNDEMHKHSLKKFGDSIGLAFQIQDDILDEEVPTEVLGKPQGIDIKNNKITYVRLYGLQKAKDKVQALYQEALGSINYLGNQAGLLRDLAGMMLGRGR